jgi:hypothetical protein
MLRPMAQLPANPRLGPLVVCLVAGLAIGVGTGAVVFNSGDDSTKSRPATKAAADARPINLPSSLAGFRDDLEVEVAKAPKGSDIVKQQTDHQAQVRRDTTAAYSKAFGGAASAYRQYSDDELLKRPYVIAVRAETPGLTLGPVVDPAYLKLAVPLTEVKTVGQVSCEINWSPQALEGQTPRPSSEHVISCQRSGSTLTVFAGGGSGFDGPTGLATMAGIVNAAYSAIAG